MSLSASLNKYRAETADAAARNLQHARPSSTAPARSSTPKPSGEAGKRTHETAFSSQPTTTILASGGGGAGSELLTQVWNAVKYLKEKAPASVAFDNLIGYLSLPNDAQKNIPLIKRALQGHEHAEYLSKTESGFGKESFRYRAKIPVSTGDELKEYLARQQTSQGIAVKDLKDGWPDCTPTLDVLETQGHILITRNKKDNTARTIYRDSPEYHITRPDPANPTEITISGVDPDFVDLWLKTKLPASEQEIRTELEKAGLTPTSQVKETRKGDGGRKEKRRVMRKGGKTTNNHMLGILKDYSRK